MYPLRAICLTLLISLLYSVTTVAQSETAKKEKWERPFREAPVFPASLREEMNEEMHLQSDSLSEYVSPEVRALSDSLINNSEQGSLTSPGAPSVVMRHHVESPRASGVYIPKAPEAPVDTTNFNWWYMLKHGRLKLSDERVEWPRVLGWCVNIYNHVNRAINSYDPVYVEPMPEDGMIRIISDNWNDMYGIDLSSNKRVGLNSRPFYTAGLDLSYFGIGYTLSLDLSNIIGNRSEDHKSHKLGLTTQVFAIDYKFNSSKDGSRIMSLSDVPDHIELGREFPGVDMRTWSLTGYYFLNNKKYSQAAAYSYSRRQKKSAGTILVGISYTSSDLFFDFEQLPADLLPYMADQETLKYRFHYRNTALLLGYAYNFAIHRNFLINLTAVPGLGINHCYEDSQDRSRNMVAFSGHGGMSAVYNLNRFFCGADAKFDVIAYRTSRYGLISNVLNFSLSVGSRF